MADSDVPIPDFMRAAYEADQEARREREAEDARREAAAAPGKRLREAAEAFHGAIGRLGGELGRPPTDDECFARLQELTEALQSAVNMGGFGDYWDTLETGFDSSVVRFWLEEDRSVVESVYRTPVGRDRWVACSRHFGFDVAEFTNDYLRSRERGDPETVDDLSGYIHSGWRWRRVLEHRVPVLAEFKRAFVTRYPNDNYDGVSLQRFVSVVAAAEGVTADEVRRRPIEWAIGYLDAPSAPPPPAVSAPLANGTQPGEGEMPKPTTVPFIR